jgi:hypothetical protein
MDVFWFVPFLVAVVIGVWLLYYRATKRSEDVGRKEGKTLVDKDAKPPPDWY